MNVIEEWFRWWVLGPTGWLLVIANLVAAFLLGIGFAIHYVRVLNSRGER